MKVPDDTDDEESSDASFDIQPVQRNDERERMLLLEKTIEGAKKAAKFTIYRYADKAYNKVEESLDFVYFSINQSQLPLPPPKKKSKLNKRPSGKN